MQARARQKQSDLRQQSIYCETKVVAGMRTQTNAFALIVQEWLHRSFPSRPRFTTRFDKTGEFEAILRAPRGSRAGVLVISTFQGNLWIRFSFPYMSYSVDSRAEMALVVRQLLSDKALFVTTHRGSKWTGTTLIRRGESPKLRRGETARVISWSGRFDNVTER